MNNITSQLISYSAEPAVLAKNSEYSIESLPPEIVATIASSINLQAEMRLKATCKKWKALTLPHPIQKDDLTCFIKKFARALSQSPLSQKVTLYQANLRNFLPRIYHSHIELGSMEDDEDDEDNTDFSDLSEFSDFLEAHHSAVILSQIPNCKQLTFNQLGPDAIKIFTQLNQLPRAEIGEFFLDYSENKTLEKSPYIFRNFWNMISKNDISHIKVYFRTFDFETNMDPKGSVSLSLSTLFSKPSFNSLTLFFNVGDYDYVDEDAIEKFQNIVKEIIDRDFQGKFYIENLKKIAFKVSFNWQTSLREITSTTPVTQQEDPLIGLILKRGHQRIGETLELPNLKKQTYSSEKKLAEGKF